MTTDFGAGLAAALAAAGLYGCAPVVQAVAARRAPPGRGAGIALTVALLRRPIWLVGLVGEIGGFALEAYAFSTAPATLVAPVASCDIAVFVVLGSLFFGSRLSVTGRWGAFVAAAAVALLALALGPDAELGRPASAGQLLACFGGCVAVVAAAVLLGQRALDDGRRSRAAGAFSVAAGVAYGVATLATRQVGRAFTPDDPWQLLTTPTPYVLIVCSILGITLMQRGLQAGPLVTFPTTSALSAFVPVVVGVVLLDDAVPSGGGRLLFAGALVLIGVGVALLAQDRSAAEAEKDAG